jgi:hypothetical protein
MVEIHDDPEVRVAVVVVAAADKLDTSLVVAAALAFETELETEKKYFELDSEPKLDLVVFHR